MKKNITETEVVISRLTILNEARWEIIKEGYETDGSLLASVRRLFYKIRSMKLNRQEYRVKRGNMKYIQEVILMFEMQSLYQLD